MRPGGPSGAARRAAATFTTRDRSRVPVERRPGLEALEMADDLAGLFGLVAVHVHARQLVPAVGAHGLQFGVAAQRLDGLVVAALADQREAQAVPGPVELGVERQGLAEGGLRLLDLVGRREQEGQVEPVAGAAFRMGLHQAPRVLDGRVAPAELRAQEAAARQRIGVVGPARQHRAEDRLGRMRIGPASSKAIACSLKAR